MVMLYAVGAVILVLIAAISINKQVGGLAAAAIIVGFGMQLFPELAVIGGEIVKYSFFALIVLLALRVFSSIAK